MLQTHIYVEYQDENMNMINVTQIIICRTEKKNRGGSGLEKPDPDSLLTIYRKK